MVRYAILFDSTKCTGCRACQVACKRWYELPDEETTSFSNDFTNPTDLSSKTWLFIKFTEFKGKEPKPVEWEFARRSCMQCQEPACAAVCPANAITKFPEGPVVVDQESCIGCRYCVEACPFDVIRYDAGQGVVYKCTMCADRIAAGQQPACVSTCPAEALEFGERQKLLAKAKERAAQVGGYVYGEKEVGGTDVLYVLTKPADQLGLKTPGDAPVSKWHAKQLFESLGIGLPVAAALAAIYVVAQRKEAARKEVK